MEWCMSLSVMTRPTYESENALEVAPMSHLLESATRTTRRAMPTKLRFVRAMSSETSTMSKEGSMA